MSLYTNVKGLITDIQKLMRDNNSLGKCMSIFQTTSWLGVLSIVLLEYYGFQELVTVQFEMKMFQEFAKILRKECIVGFVVALFYIFVIKIRLRQKLIDIKLKKHKNYFPVKKTAEGVWAVLFYGLISLKIICDFILCIAGENVIDIVNAIIYFCVIIENAINYIYRVYEAIEDSYENLEIRYTDFFDSLGKRVPRDGLVVYENRLYNLHFEDKQWWLSKRDNRFPSKDIALEMAAKDEKGKLRVYYTGMGKKEIL